MPQIVVLSTQASTAPPAPVYVVGGDDTGLSPRGRALAAILAVALLLVGVLACAWAGATPITGARATPPATPAPTQPAAGNAGAAVGQTMGNPATGEVALADVVKGEWDGPTTHLDWTGKTYTTVEATFVGDRVASPGDLVQRTLNIANSGPSGAVMTVSLVLAEQLPAGAQNPELASGINLFWDVGGVKGNERFAELMTRQGSRPTVAEVQVPQGATVAVRVGFEMPASVTEHRSDGAPSDLLTFDVLVRMQGDTAAPGVVPDAVFVPRLPGGNLAVTGAAVLGVIALAAGLLLGGFLLIAAKRRRRREDDAVAVQIPQK